MEVETFSTLPVVRESHLKTKKNVTNVIVYEKYQSFNKSKGFCCTKLCTSLHIILMRLNRIKVMNVRVGEGGG